MGNHGTWVNHSAATAYIGEEAGGGGGDHGVAEAYLATVTLESLRIQGVMGGGRGEVADAALDAYLDTEEAEVHEH